MDDQQLAAAPSATEAAQAGADQTTDINVALSDEMYPNEGRTPNEGDDTAPVAEGTDTVEGAEGDPAAEAIDPPHSWNADDRKAWDALPAEAKQTVLRR